MARVIAVLAVVAVVSAFLLGINLGGAIDPVRTADARYKDAQTDVYINQQAIDQTKQQNELDHQKRMSDLEFQYAPTRIQNEVYIQRLEAENWAKVRDTVSIGIAVALGIIALAFAGPRLIKAIAEVRNLSARPQANPVPVNQPSRRELYQAIQAQKNTTEWLERQAKHEASKENTAQYLAPQQASMHTSRFNNSNK